MWFCHGAFFFFFSSRRRHTRFDCDWSSDVCSSDLSRTAAAERKRRPGAPRSMESYRQKSSVQDLIGDSRSEEHTSELQSQSNLVCRLLLEKKKKNKKSTEQ